MMKQKFILLLAAFLSAFSLNILAGDDYVVNKAYEITQVGVGSQGTCLIKVTYHSKRGKETDDTFLRGAVHGVIFRGAPAVASPARIPALRPLVSSPQVEMEKADYFNGLFIDQFRGYATIVGGSYERVKAAKNGYRISCTVQVNRDELRKALEQADIVRSLGSGF